MKRGHQGVDWFNQFTAANVEQELIKAAATSLADIFRLNEIRSMLAKWPSQHTDDRAVYAALRVGALSVYATCIFVRSSGQPRRVTKITDASSS